MQICQAHWTALYEAVRVRGMGHLVAANGRDALARTTAELAGEADPDDFEPLLAMTWMIYSRAIELGMGYLLLGPEPERGLPDCPVCEAVRRHPDPCPNGCTPESYERWWIDGPADAVMQEAERRGLLLAL